MNTNVAPSTLKLDMALSDEPSENRLIPGSARAPKKANSKSFLIFACVTAFIAVASYFGWEYWTVWRFEESTDDAYVEADSTIVAPKVSGYIDEVLVSDNERVTGGEPLARIDDRDYVVALNQAKADVAAAEADIANAEAGIEQQRATINQAEAVVNVDNADLTFAQQEYDRSTDLANKGSGSIQSAQQATSKLLMARATLQRDLAAVRAAQKKTDLLKAQLGKANAALTHDEAVKDQAQLNLSYTTIKAPLAGIVGNRTLRVGQYVQSGTQLMAVVPVERAYVVANFKETQLTNVRAGQRVQMIVDTFPDVLLRGTVDSIAPASGEEFALLPPDNATGNFTKIVQRVPVKIVIDERNPLSGQLRAGMSVTPTIDTKGSERPK
jgi:membrane fusion protein, multidrug efflux system